MGLVILGRQKYKQHSQ